MNKRTYVDFKKCTKCKRCINQCPVHAFMIWRNNFVLIDSDLCTVCGKCLEVCPINGIHLIENFRFEETQDCLEMFADRHI